MLRGQFVSGHMRCILARTTECCQGLENGVASGIIGRETDALSGACATPI